MAVKLTPAQALADFFENEMLAAILYPVKSGKEATVYCCRGGNTAGGGLVAVKLYHEFEFRTFHNDVAYREGQVILDKRLKRAVQQKSRFGREFQYGSWLQNEYTVLQRLYNAGADVPRPIDTGGRAIIMEFVGDDEGPAELLNAVRPERDEAESLYAAMLHNIELLLACHVIHGDLSPFNVLYNAGRLTIIDFPQSVDPRLNPNARQLLHRDVENVSRYFARRGVYTSPEWFAEDLWNRYCRSEL